MNRIISIFILIVFSNSTIYCQSKQWDKIIILDVGGESTGYTNEYHIIQNDSSIVIQNQLDSILIPVSPIVIKELLVSIDRNKENPDDPLTMFNKDSTWLIENAESLWDGYLGKRNKLKEIDSLAVNSIRNYQMNKEIIWSLQGSKWWTDDYSYVAVSIIRNKDTTTISSIGGYPFMLPWMTSNDEIYNSDISIAISKLLPNIKNSNKERLSGTGFTSLLMENIYSSHVSTKARLITTRKRHPIKFYRLEKHFEILYAEKSFMGSIDWGRNIVANCLEVDLRDLNPKYDNIRFSCIFGKRLLFLYPTFPFIKNKKKLLNKLENNPVFQYTLENQSCTGEIRFVNNKSLSNLGKKEFLIDLKDTGQNPKQLKGQLKNSIFFELFDSKEDKTSFSRWLFLENGKIILWELKGDFLMNLPNKYIEDQGYICKEIKFD